MFVLGIDIGTTNIKAGIYDSLGHEIVHASVFNGKIYQHFHGYFELDMENIWELTKSLICKLVRDFEYPQDIISIGVCGHGNGLYLLDEYCQPVHNGISSLDSRAQFMVERTSNPAEALLDKVYWHTPLAYIKWLKKYDLATYKKARWLLYSKDWINYKLTGVLATDTTNTASSGITRSNKKTIDEALFKTFDLIECYKMVPQILDPMDVLGSVSDELCLEMGLKKGTPVICGAHDVAACSLGAGGVYHGHLTSIIGTWSINYLVLNNNHGNLFAHILPDMSAIYFGDVNSGNCLDWYIELFCEKEKQTAIRQNRSVYEIIDEAVEYEPPTDIIFSPHLYPSVDSSSSSSGFIGIHNWHTKPQIIKSIYEGLAFSYYIQIKKIAKHADIPSIHLVGGGSGSKIWPQIFADITNKPVKVLSHGCTSCKGVALASLLGIKPKTSLKAFTSDIYDARTYYTNQTNHRFYLDKFSNLIEQE